MRLVPLSHMQTQHSIMEQGVCFGIRIGCFWIFTLRLYRPSVTHIPFESHCQTQSDALPPGLCCCDCLSNAVVTQKLWLMTYLSAALDPRGAGGLRD